MLIGILTCLVYLLLLFVMTKISGVKYTKIISSTKNIKNGLFIPVAIGSLVLLVFSVANRWVPAVFTYSPILYQPLLWLIPLLITATAIIRLFHARWQDYTTKGLILLVCSSLLVGFSEELLVRGILVHSLLQAGYSLVIVGLLSSIIFGTMHAINYFNGQDAKTTLVQMFATSIYGISFFIVLIITGSLWAAILLHAFHDFSLLTQGGEVNNPDTKPHLTETILSLILLVIPILGLIIIAR